MGNQFHKPPAPDTAPNTSEQLAITFEIAKPEDWKELAKIRLEALEKDPKSFIGVKAPEIPAEDDESKWRSYIEDPEKFFLFVKSGDEVIGLIGAWNLGENVWYMQWGYIKPNFRRRGAGEAMIIEMVEEIERRGARKIIANILKANENFDRVKKFTEKLGFKVVPNRFPGDHQITIQLDCME
jgi:ribosomal protein S18 acetylase RimI-like enzyme